MAARGFGWIRNGVSPPTYHLATLRGILSCSRMNGAPMHHPFRHTRTSSGCGQSMALSADCAPDVLLGSAASLSICVTIRGRGASKRRHPAVHRGSSRAASARGNLRTWRHCGIGQNTTALSARPNQTPRAPCQVWIRTYGGSSKMTSSKSDCNAGITSIRGRALQRTGIRAAGRLSGGDSRIC